MNRLDELLYHLKKDMKNKKIKSIVMAKDLGISNVTITNTFKGKIGSFETLNKIIDYIDNK